MIAVHMKIFLGKNHDHEVEPTRQRDMVKIEGEDADVSGYACETDYAREYPNLISTVKCLEPAIHSHRKNITQIFLKKRKETPKI